MGSRLRENVKQLFECFCEIAAPVGEKPAWILQKYPNSFSDEEILKSVPKFTYPCEFENLLVQHFSFVLTSIDSKWTFGFCRHDPKTETALVVLSALPWHETFYKLLNHIASLTSNASGEDLWKFLENIYTCGVPIPGNSISISLPNSTANFICQSPKQFQLPSIPENRNLTEYYSAIDSNNMMVIFASMLYERRIIFISKRLSRLSACVQACNALIYPMIWQHIYIPVLPLSLIDYLLAPMPFLIGVPTSTLQKVPKSDLGEVVILDADNNTIESPFQDLESLPQDVVTNLKKALRNRSTLLGDGVSRAFLRALVQLTAGYREALTLQQGERITFNQNAFVESRPSSMQPFLRKMLELQIFQQFIEERLNMLNSGLGFSDEFEMEACSYSAKSSSKFMQQYREWTYTMRKESSAFFRSVKDKANPAVKYAVKSYQQVKDKGKDMKTAYKGLKWKGRPNRSETNMRFHQPRSAPSSPTLDRRPIGFTSPSKSPNGVSATTSYRKELRLRNTNFDASKKQYSPLNPSSPEESDSPPERINIDLMHELQDVIFPKIPAVDRTLKPVRSLDNLRPAWSGHLRHSPSPSTVITNPCEISSKKSILTSSPYPLPSDTSFNQSKMFSSNLLASKTNRTVKEVDKTSLLPASASYNQNTEPNRFLHELNIHNNLMKPVVDLSLCVHEKENPKTEENFSSNNKNVNCKDNFTNANSISNTWTSESFDRPFKTSNFLHEVNEDDPFDTSKVLMPIYLQTAPLFKSKISSMPAPFHPLSHPFNTTSCSAHVKDSPEVPDLIRLDSTNSNEDFDPLLSKVPELSSTKQMSQSLHLPEMNEGLSNPLYPYFQQSSHKNNDKPKASDNVGDMDLLQAYGIDFSKFSLTNSDNPSTKTTTVCNRSVPDNKINNVDTMDTFNLTLNTSAIKSPNNWTKFE
ncbi:DENN domain-containing protein 1A isoform X1 [Camponotus floridanus]|uniref:DENN domain-containing protein 1A isoform X1 n=1 Tax=Camponotus floridanus TaxID=104421 RepID=UPI000DC6CD5A|nr:DENN domain-containing protein 1A isoform X1 [Camponotus floridanus]